MAIPVIAIVGRPNVGKSTLFNRLAGERIAVVSDIAGTTRDRVSADAKWKEEPYILVDTAGIEGNSEDIFWPDMQSQVLKALDEADSLIFVTDTHQGLTTADRDAANLIRRYHKPVILAANKADNIELFQACLKENQKCGGEKFSSFYPVCFDEWSAEKHGPPLKYGPLYESSEEGGLFTESVVTQKALGEGISEEVMCQQMAVRYPLLRHPFPR